MRVLHISSERSWRGGEQQMAYLISELDKYSVQNHVLCRENSEFHNYCKSNSIVSYAKSFSGLGVITTAFALVKICKQYDLIHAHTAKAHFVAFLAAIFGLKRPIIAARRVDFVPSASWLTKWRYSHQRIVRVLCVSRKIKSIMDDYLPQIKDKTVMIHSGIDLSKFKNEKGERSIREIYNIPSQHTLVCNTSALADHKDYFTFLDTAHKLVKNKAGMALRFIIFGDGPLKTEIKNYVEKLGLSNHVIMAGFVNNLNHLLPQADIFMITSKTEGLGTSVLDALASDLPVVATRAGGIPEMIIHEETGLLADVGDSEQLAKNVLRVISDKQLRHELVKNGASKALEFSKEKTAMNTLSIYREVLDT